MPQSILDITFSDLYVAESLESSYYKATPDSRMVLPVPEHLREEFTSMRRTLHEKAKGTAFSIEWGTKPKSEWLRIKAIHTARANPLFVCRRAILSKEESPPTLLDLGFPAEIVRRLLARPINQGLILFMGSMGAGKTTAAATFVRDYTSKHGGVCFTIDNPIEIHMDGRCGNGMIHQNEIACEADMANELRGMLRSSANMLFPQEITLDNTAREVLVLSTSGHPVVSTLHAADMVSGLARFSALTGGNNSAFADALTAAFHLTLTNSSQGAVDDRTRGDLPGRSAPPKRLLTVTPLMIMNDNEKAIRSGIRGGTFHQLISEVERQKRLFMNAVFA